MIRSAKLLCFQTEEIRAEVREERGNKSQRIAEAYTAVQRLMKFSSWMYSGLSQHHLCQECKSDKQQSAVRQAGSRKGKLTVKGLSEFLKLILSQKNLRVSSVSLLQPEKEKENKREKNMRRGQKVRGEHEEERRKRVCNGHSLEQDRLLLYLLPQGQRKNHTQDWRIAKFKQ